MTTQLREVAELFLKQLPSHIPPPEVEADLDGEINFEWYLEPRKVFSISLNAEGRLSYAGLFGPAKSHGTEMFQDSIPREIILKLDRLFS